MTPPKRTEIGVTPTIPLPSADLIVYRFDQMDKKFENLDAKLDNLTNNFLTKEEAQMLREERDSKLAEIERRLDTYRWYWRAVFSAAALALLTALVALVVKR